MSGCEREMTKQEMIEQIRSLIDENTVLKSKLEDVYESVGLKKVENAEKYRIEELEELCKDLQDQHQQDCIRYNDMRTAFLKAVDELGNSLGGVTMIDFSKYPYAVARIYETINDRGFPKIIIKPIFSFKKENIAIESAKAQRELQKNGIMQNQEDDLLSLCNINSIRAIKIYEVD